MLSFDLHVEIPGAPNTPIESSLDFKSWLRESGVGNAMGTLWSVSVIACRGSQRELILEQWVEVKHPKVAESWITSFEEAQTSLSSESSTTLNWGQMCTKHHWDMWDSNTDEKTATLIALG